MGSKIYDGVSYGISTLGIVSASLTNVTEILNICLLVFSILNILVVTVFKVYQIIKDKGITKESVEEIEDVLESAEDKINDKTS